MRIVGYIIVSYVVKEKMKMILIVENVWRDKNDFGYYCFIYLNDSWRCLPL